MVWRVPAAHVGGGDMYFALWVYTYNTLWEGLWSDFDISGRMGATAFTGEFELMQVWRTFSSSARVVNFNFRSILLMALGPEGKSIFGKQEVSTFWMSATNSFVSMCSFIFQVFRYIFKTFWLAGSMRVGSFYLRA